MYKWAAKDRGAMDRDPCRLPNRAHQRQQILTSSFSLD